MTTVPAASVAGVRRIGSTDCTVVVLPLITPALASSVYCEVWVSAAA